MDPLSADAHDRPAARGRSQRAHARALPAKVTMREVALVFVLLWIGVLVAVRPARGAEHESHGEPLRVGTLAGSTSQF
jgi:hypothetical protein